MRAGRRSYLICYDVDTTDVAGERRLRRVSKACVAYGQRVQYSVFECFVTDVLMEELRERLLDIIDSGKDSLRIYSLAGDRDVVVEVHGVDRWVDFSGELIV